MIFETVVSGGCRSYLYGCEDTRASVLIDPCLSQLDNYARLIGQHGLRVEHIVETHTHADHFSAAKKLSARLGAPIVMHESAASKFANMRLQDGDRLKVGDLHLDAMYTPGHTADSMCMIAEDRVFTGDTLLIGGTGRTDLPTGDAKALYHSLFENLLTLPPGLLVLPAHEYRGRSHSTIGDEIANNKRLQVGSEAEFVELMNKLNLSQPTHLTEALRVNVTGGATVSELLSDAALGMVFVSQKQMAQRLSSGNNEMIVLDVRETTSFEQSHIPGAVNLPRGQIEILVNTMLPDPTQTIVAYCDCGRISTLAASTLQRLGFTKVCALDGGINAWRAEGYPTN